MSAVTTGADAAAAGPGAVILVVDDNAAKRVSIVSMLEQLGHEMVEADSGEAALRAVIKRSFAAIVLDVQMPGMSGYETAGLIRMRTQSEQTPILFLTADAADEADIPAACASGPVAFICAPIVPDILRAKIAGLVDQSRERDERTCSELDNVANGVVMISQEGVIESVNRAAAELFGYEEVEAIGALFATIVSPKVGDDRAAPVMIPTPAMVLKDTAGRPVEAVGHRNDGSTFPIELELSDVLLGARKVHIGCLRDIFEHQTATEARRYQAVCGT
jgi:PAS domain S-box-containing protein